MGPITRPSWPARSILTYGAVCLDGQLDLSRPTHEHPGVLADYRHFIQERVEHKVFCVTTGGW